MAKRKVLSDTTGLTQLDQLALHLAGPVDATTLQVHPPDQQPELPVTLSPDTLRPLRPVVVATSRDLQHSAHHPDRVLAAASMDTAVSHFDSLAKYRAASLKKSRSSVTWASSRRSLVSSSSRPLP